MAIFDTSQELTRQSRTVAPNVIGRGSGSGLMKALGYDPTTGQENKWGSVLHAIPGMSTATNLIAGNVTKGTDLNQVIKEGRDEALAYDLNKIALGTEIFKMGASAGLGGGIGSGLSNPLARTLLGNSPDLLTNTATDTDGINSISTDDLDEAKASMSPMDYRRYVKAMGYNEPATGNNMVGVNKTGGILNNIGNLGGVANALTRTIQGGMAYNNELDQASKGLYKTVDEPFSYL